MWLFVVAKEFKKRKKIYFFKSLNSRFIFADFNFPSRHSTSIEIPIISPSILSSLGVKAFCFAFCPPRAETQLSLAVVQQMQTRMKHWFDKIILLLSIVIILTVLHANGGSITDEGQSSEGPDCGCGGVSRDTKGGSIDVDLSGVIDDVIEVEMLGLKSIQFDNARTPMKTGENPKQEATVDMVFISGGNTFIGTDKPQVRGDGESPLRTITLSPYFIDRYAVTNAGNLLMLFFKFIL
jgi:hypothetical protein